MIIFTSLITISTVFGCGKKNSDPRHDKSFAEQDAAYPSGYTCAGDGQCLNSNVNQPSGNILCSSNFMFKEDAIQRCQFENRRTNSCDGMIEYQTADGTRYELVKTSNDGCQATEQFSVLQQNSSNFRFINISPQPKQERSRRSTPTSSSTAIILEHGDKPFRQTMTFYQEDNMTAYEVDAHLEYTKNVIYRLHALNTMIVITPDTCLFAEDSEQMESKLKSETPFVITTANTQEMKRTISIVPAQISLDPYPSIIQEYCANKTIFEEEYELHDESDESTFRVSFAELQKEKRQFHNGRSRREIKECSMSRCGSDDIMMAQCTKRNCATSYCIYIPVDEGTTQAGKAVWNHIVKRNYFCMPCCLDTSTYHKMPTCGEITYANALCNWFHDKGRCGDNFK